MTGMPPFLPTHKEEEVWKIVAFVRHLPEITSDEEKALRTESEGADHHHDEPRGRPARPIRLPPRRRLRTRTRRERRRITTEDGESAGLRK
jgi:hypothetical protein